MIVGPCRSGTTALSNTFARCGILTDEQPRKSIGRALEEKNEVPFWTIRESGLLVSKETLGPKTEAEYFDPIESIVALGYPTNKIKLIVITREPLATYSSCQRMWGNIDPVAIERAYIETLAIAAKTLDLGIATTFYVHEAIRDNPEQMVTEKLFQRLHIPFETQATDWSNGPAFGERGSHIVFYDNPPEKFVNGVKRAQGYAFRNSGTIPDPKYMLDLEGTKVFEIYHYFKNQCEADLGIKV